MSVIRKVAQAGRTPAAASGSPFAYLGELARLAGPVIAGRLGVTAMGLSDAIVVGRYSASQLGYHAIAWAIASIVIFSSLGLLSGVQVMASRALGEGRPGEAGAVLRRGLVYALWISLACACVLIGLGPACLRALNLKGDLAQGAARPLMIMALSTPAFAISTAATSWLEGLGRPAVPNALMWAANILNLGVDLVLVPGAFGLPPLGAVGAATATFSARLFLAVALLAYVSRMPDARALGVFDRAPKDRWRETEQRRIGYGAGASSLFEISAFAGKNIDAGWIGPLVVAAWAVVLNVTAFVFMVPLGLSVATGVQVAKARGAGDAAGMRQAALTGFAVAAVFGCLFAVALWPEARWVALIYTSQPATVAMAAGGLVVTCLMFPPDAVQVVAAQSLRARGDILVPSLTHLASYAVVMLPLAWLLAVRAGLGLTGIVAACVIASLLSAGLLLGRFWMLSRRD